MIIKNCYDSHLHWQGIGSFKSRLDLSDVKNIIEVESLSTAQQNYRADWLMGHGWSKEIFSNKDIPLNYLDRIYPDIPVYFTSKDIHCVWLNSKAIEQLGINNEAWKKENKNYIEFNNGKFAGLFYDLAKDSIDKLLPAYSLEQVKQHLLIAQNIILKAGITHIRDLTCSKDQLMQAIELEKSGELHLVADLYFKLNSYAEAEQHVKNVLKYKKLKTDKLKIKGVKVFLDGALGSGGALLTSCYLDNTNGFKLFTDEQLEDIIELCFANNLEIAFHTIGDQSSLDICKVLSNLKNKGVEGKVHLEHVQVLTDECIELIKSLKVVCHMQPQHWCSDKDWLHKKIQKQSLKNIFRWADLEKNNVELYFGSDAPVENLSVGNLLKCLDESAENNIAPIKGEVLKYVSYPSDSPISSETHLTQDLNVDKVVINGKIVFQA